MRIENGVRLLAARAEYSLRDRKRLNLLGSPANAPLCLAGPCINNHKKYDSHSARSSPSRRRTTLIIQSPITYLVGYASLVSLSTMSAVASVMIASASAVAKVFVILGIGYVAAIRPRPIPLMPPNAINSISKMNLYLLVIPLIYSTIASSVTPEKLGSAWFVLLSAIGVICLSYCVASLLGRLPFFRVDNKTDFDALRISAAFPNILAL